MLVKTCSKYIARENVLLNQEMARLTKNLTNVKKAKQSQPQPYQDNTAKGQKRLDEGENMVYFVCHKSYQCKIKNGGENK